MKNLMLAAILLVSAIALSGCTSEDEKIKELLHRYGNETARQMYDRSGFISSNRTFDNFTPKIVNVKIYSKDKVKDTGGVTLHFVRAKIVYFFEENSGATKFNHTFFRYMALTIEEDGFGEMKVDVSKSKEVYAAGADEKEMKLLCPEAMERGEKLISAK